MIRDNVVGLRSGAWEIHVRPPLTLEGVVRQIGRDLVALATDVDAAPYVELLARLEPLITADTPSGHALRRFVGWIGNAAGRHLYRLAPAAAWTITRGAFAASHVRLRVLRVQALLLGVRQVST
jgi:hypothetical protein